MSAFERIITAYADNLQELIAVAYSVLRDINCAQDVVQDVIAKLVEFPYRVQSVEQPLPFLRTCVRNEAINYIRKNYKFVPTFDDMLDNLRSVLNDNEYREVENLLWVRSYLNGKSPEFCDAFLRHVLDGWTINELAGELGVTPTCLQKQFALIKAKLRKDVTMYFTLIFQNIC